MLSARIFVLEKNMIDSRTHGVQAQDHQKTNLNYDKLLAKVTTYIDHIMNLSLKELDVVHIRQLVANLKTMMSKEANLERLIEEMNGFLDHFNDQWIKFNNSHLQNNTSISMFG